MRCSSSDDSVTRPTTPRGRPSGRPLPFWQVAAGLLLLGVCLLGGCRTESERRGVSSLPVNRPAGWERQGGMVEGGL